MFILLEKILKDFLLISSHDIDVVESDEVDKLHITNVGQLIGYPIINLNNFKKSVNGTCGLLKK